MTDITERIVRLREWVNTVSPAPRLSIEVDVLTICDDYESLINIIKAEANGHHEINGGAFTSLCSCGMLWPCSIERVRRLL